MSDRHKKQTVTVSISEDTYHALTEGFGDGSLNWDMEDSEPVYEFFQDLWRQLHE